MSGASRGICIKRSLSTAKISILMVVLFGKKKGFAKEVGRAEVKGGDQLWGVHGDASSIQGEVANGTESDCEHAKTE
jgi:hypothetical protein